MYADPKHIRDREVKVRLDDEEPELARLQFMAGCGLVAALALVLIGAALIGMRVG